MKQLVALAVLTATVHAQPSANRKVSIKLATGGRVISAPSVVIGGDCATLTSITQKERDLVAVAICPVGTDKLAVSWVVRDGDQTESAAAVGSSAHGATFSANFPNNLPHRYDVDVTVD